MIRRIEAINFRCLRYVSRALSSFHVLVGPNASGKTTFLDVVAFLRLLISEGVDEAVLNWSTNFDDLLWGRKGDQFEVAIEVAIPDDRRERLSKPFDTIRYEVRIGRDSGTQEVGILEEKAWLMIWDPPLQVQRQFFPAETNPPPTILTGHARTGWQRVLSKAPKGNDNFYVEVRDEGAGKGWFPSIKLGPKRSALKNLPDDESKFPVATWLKSTLAQGIQSLVLNSQLIRLASPPGQSRSFKPDGSNLPWVIDQLSKDKVQFSRWIGHVQTALPDIEHVRTVVREDDRHRYLMICHRGGLEVPSWIASDGTLRLLALTILAYLAQFRGVYLIEEPENGIHPSAVETIYQSLSSTYDAQVLLATHSPVILRLADPEKLLCFKKTDTGATDIALGSEHPALREWKGQTDLGTLFAAGVLG